MPMVMSRFSTSDRTSAATGSKARSASVLRAKAYCTLRRSTVAGAKTRLTATA
jgi:hypothetical protein